MEFFFKYVLQQATVIKMNNIHPAGQDNLQPPAKECRCSHAADAEKQSASCSVPSEDPYLETQT